MKRSLIAIYVTVINNNTCAFIDGYKTSSTIGISSGVLVKIGRMPRMHEASEYFLKIQVVLIFWIAMAKLYLPSPCIFAYFSHPAGLTKCLLLSVEQYSKLSNFVLPNVWVR